MHPNLLMLLLMLGSVGLMLGAAAIGLMAWSLIHPPRMTDGKAAWVLRRLSPADVGLRFSETFFDIRDEHGKPLRIAAWWIPHPDAQGRCAVLLHGYADAKVGAIAWAPLWHDLGFNLLVPDLRGHGESGGSVCAAGYFERQDLVQVIDDLRAARPAETRQLVLFGVSLGASVAAAAAIDATDVAAVVMDSPFADFRHAAMAHMDRLGLPGRWMQRRAIDLAQWLTRARYDAVRPADLVKRVPCPVLLIESGADPFLSADDRAALEMGIRSRPVDLPPGEIWNVEGVEHLMALSASPQDYRQRVASFLADALIVPRAPLAQPRQT